jgi:diguanylate cyclase (GGDEF)-like protein/PAS domain S-box-containing protein
MPRHPAADPSEQSRLLLDEAFVFRAFMTTTPDSVYVKDREARLRRVSRTMAANLGYAEPDELVGKSDIDLFGEEFGRRTYIEDLRVMENDEPISGLVESRQLANGEVNWTLTSKLPLHDEAGHVVGMLGVTREINELKQAELNLNYLATHDSLTSLPNRYLLMDRLGQVIARARRDQQRFGVLFIDIDDFKSINDTAGHDAGDAVLRSVADRIRSCVRGSDTVSRLGGDEFVMVVEDADSAGAVSVAEKIRAAMAVPVVRQRRRLAVTASVGISLYPDHATDAEGLLTAADYAMYLAKKHGKDRSELCPADVKSGRSARPGRARAGPAG